MGGRAANQFGEVATVYDSLMTGVPYAQWVDYLEQLWRFFDWAPASVLELACGTGTVMAELRERGYRVAGVDNSPAMLAEARRKLGEDVPLFLQDAADLRLDGPYDACICLFDSLNYLLEWEQLRDCCRGVRRLLAPGGSFIFDVNSLRALETNMFTQTGAGQGRNPLSYEWQSVWSPETRLCTVEMEYHVLREGRLESFRETHVQRGYTLAELGGAVRAGGLTLLASYDAYTFHPASQAGDRYFLTAQRPPGEAE